MKCPLIAIGYLASNRIDASRKCECGKEKCAWWDKTAEKCAIISVIPEIVSIAQSLEAMRQNMPHAGQFKK